MVRWSPPPCARSFQPTFSVWRWNTREHRQMKRKRLLWSLSILTAVLGGCVVRSLASFNRLHRGTVANVSELKPVFLREERWLAFALTNSFIQEFPFRGQIEWNLSHFQGTMLFITGAVDTNLLHQYLNGEPDASVSWQGSKNEFEDRWPDARQWPSTIWTNVDIEKEFDFGTYKTSARYSIDMVSCRVRLRML